MASWTFNLELQHGAADILRQKKSDQPKGNILIMLVSPPTTAVQCKKLKINTPTDSCYNNSKISDDSTKLQTLVATMKPCIYNNHLFHLHL